jgi:hypothetical protein
MPDEKRGLFPDWDDVAWVLKYDDIETLTEEELDEDEKRRHRALP